MRSVTNALMSDIMDICCDWFSSRQEVWNYTVTKHIARENTRFSYYIFVDIALSATRNGKVCEHKWSVHTGKPYRLDVDDSADSLQGLFPTCRSCGLVHFCNHKARMTTELDFLCPVLSSKACSSDGRTPGLHILHSQVLLAPSGNKSERQGMLTPRTPRLL